MEIKGPLLRFLLFIGLCFTLPANASSSLVPSEILACDTCDYAKAEWLVMQELDAPNCEFTDPSETVATPDDAWCSSLPSIVIVANPLTEDAWKFRAQHSCVDGSCDYANPILQQLVISADENEAVDTFFSYHNVVQDAVHAVQNSGHDFFTGASSFSQASAISGFAMNSGTPQDCSMSPVQYLIDLDFRQELYDAMAGVISDHIGDTSFQDIISSRRTDSRGFGVNLRGGGDMQVSYEHLGHDLYHVVSFGDPSRDRLMFKIDYHGNATVSGVDPLYLEFSLRRSASVIEGRPLGGITADGAGVNLTHDNIGCLSELLNDPSLGTTIGVSEPLSDLPPAWQGLDFDLCERQTELRTCSEFQGSAQCSTTLVRDIVPCG